MDSKIEKLFLKLQQTKDEDKRNVILKQIEFLKTNKTVRK